MPTKKKAPKKKSAAKKKESSPQETVEVADRLVIQVAIGARDNADLQMQLAQARVGEREREKEAAEAQLSRLMSQLNEKYNLTPGKDKVDVQTGIITRG